MKNSSTSKEDDPRRAITRPDLKRQSTIRPKPPRRERIRPAREIVLLDLSRDPRAEPEED
jgi:hypothetical protein